MNGFLYILSNRAIPGLVKVGYTTRSVDERVQELTTTGVPGKFIVDFYCYVDNAPYLEKMVHFNLSSCRYDKEFFKCDAETAIRIVKKTIRDTSIIYYSSGGKLKSSWLSESEKNEMLLEAENRKKEVERKRNEQRARANEIKNLVNSFMHAAPYINSIIKHRHRSGSPLRLLGSFLAGATVIGLSVIDKIDPPFFEDGCRIGRNLNETELKWVIYLKDITLKLEALDALSHASNEYIKLHGQSDCYLFSDRGSRLSCWLRGMYSVT